MSQHDMNIANASAAAVRADLNLALAALVGTNSGATAPATTYAYMYWADTTTGLLKQRNGANTAWKVIGSLSAGGAFMGTFFAAKTGAYTVVDTDVGATFLCTNTFTLTLTAAATLGNGFMFAVKNNGTGIITIDPNAAELIDGQATITLNPGRSAIIACNGTAWYTLSKEGRYEAAAIASAATLNLDNVYGEFVHVTGTTTITAITLAQGALKTVVFDGSLTLTNGASLILPSAANIVTGANDVALFVGEGAGVVRCVCYEKYMGSSVARKSEIISINATVAANAMTLTLNPCVLDFRANSLTSGAVYERAVSSAITTTISSGSTGGTVSGVANKIVVLAIDNAGTVELAWTNVAGGLNLDESTLISTTAEGGAGAADSANVIYSTTARTNVPFRVVGYVESTQVTAGTWATAPSKIQGVGGQAMAAQATLGHGQTYNDVTASRAFGTTYYNTSGKPILVVTNYTYAATADQLTFTVNGVAVQKVSGNSTYVAQPQFAVVVPPGASYSISRGTANGAMTNWFELR